MTVLQSSADRYGRLFLFVTRIIRNALVPVSLAQNVYRWFSYTKMIFLGIVRYTCFG